MMSQQALNSSGWEARLELHFRGGQPHTQMTRNWHIGPLTVQRPFYPQGNSAHVYLLHPPGGIVGGDSLDITVSTQHQAQVLLTSPGAAKFYRSHEAIAQVQVELQVAAGASLQWLPQENILFNGARVHSDTRIYLEDNAVFIGWDITCLGRPHSQEVFTQGLYRGKLQLYHNYKLLFVEHQQVYNQDMLQAASGLRGHPLQACLLAFPCTDEHLQQVRHYLQDLSLLDSAVTLCDEVLVLRVLGQHNEHIKNHLIDVWRLLHPALLQGTAVAPRIWST